MTFLCIYLEHSRKIKVYAKIYLDFAILSATFPQNQKSYSNGSQGKLKVSCLESSTWYIILVFVILMLSVLLAGNNSGNSSDFAICFLKRCQSVWQDRKTTNCAFRPKIRELQICCKQFVTLCAHRFQLACLLAQKLF